MKLFPTHIREGANCGAMFSLLKATQDFCLEGLCWAKESCLTSPVKAACEGWRGMLSQRSRQFE